MLLLGTSQRYAGISLRYASRLPCHLPVCFCPPPPASQIVLRKNSACQRTTWLFSSRTEFQNMIDYRHSGWCTEYIFRRRRFVFWLTNRTSTVILGKLMHSVAEIVRCKNIRTPKLNQIHVSPSSSQLHVQTSLMPTLPMTIGSSKYHLLVYLDYNLCNLCNQACRSLQVKKSITEPFLYIPKDQVFHFQETLPLPKSISDHHLKSSEGSFFWCPSIPDFLPDSRWAITMRMKLLYQATGSFIFILRCFHEFLRVCNLIPREPGATCTEQTSTNFCPWNSLCNIHISAHPPSSTLI